MKVPEQSKSNLNAFLVFLFVFPGICGQHNFILSGRIAVIFGNVDRGEEDEGQGRFGPPGV